MPDNQSPCDPLQHENEIRAGHRNCLFCRQALQWDFEFRLGFEFAIEKIRSMNLGSVMMEAPQDIPGMIADNLLEISNATPSIKTSGS